MFDEEPCAPGMDLSSRSGRRWRGWRPSTGGVVPRGDRRCHHGNLPWIIRLSPSAKVAIDDAGTV